jgi:hypothetical protein
VYNEFMNYLLTSYLFSRPSAVSGAARMLDFGGFYDAYNSSPSGAEADAKALYSDWRTVGNHIMEACGKIALEAEKSNESERRAEAAPDI